MPGRGGNGVNFGRARTLAARCAGGGLAHASMPCPRARSFAPPLPECRWTRLLPLAVEAGACEDIVTAARARVPFNAGTSREEAAAGGALAVPRRRAARPRPRRRAVPPLSGAGGSGGAGLASTTTTAPGAGSPSRSWGSLGSLASSPHRAAAEVAVLPAPGESGRGAWHVLVPPAPAAAALGGTPGGGGGPVPGRARGDSPASARTASDGEGGARSSDEDDDGGGGGEEEDASVAPGIIAPPRGGGGGGDGGMQNRMGGGGDEGRVGRLADYLAGARAQVRSGCGGV